MGEARHIAETVTSALEARDYDRVRKSLADDFVFDDPTSPQPPMNAEQWIESNRRLQDAFDDFSYNFKILLEEGNNVWVETHIAGTHTRDWDLSLLGAGVIPATGIEVYAGASVTRGTINGDRLVIRIELVEQDADGGITGILQQLGFQAG